MQFKIDGKSIVKLFLVLLLLYLIYVLVRFFVDKKSANLRSKENRKPTITKAQAQLLADRLYVAMDIWGTDENEVQSVFDSLRNNSANLALVNNAFGYRRYDPVAGTSGVIKVFYAPAPLYSWLKSELSAKEFQPWAELYDKLA